METSTPQSLIGNTLARVAEIHGCDIFPLHVVIAQINGEIIHEHSHGKPWKYPHDKIAMLKMAHRVHGGVPKDRVEYFRDQLEAVQDLRHWGVASKAGIFIACSSDHPWFAEAVATFHAPRLIRES